MFAVDVQISGREKPFGRLEKTIEKVGNAVVRGVAYRTGQAIRTMAPKGKLSHPGPRLAKDVITKPQGKRTFSIMVGSNLYRPYWYYQEYGFKGHLVSKTEHPEVKSLKGPFPGLAGIRTKPFKSDGYFIGPALRNVPIYIDREVKAQTKRFGR